MDFYKLNWKDLYYDSLTLGKEIKSRKLEIDRIVSIARGGLVVARILSDYLKLPISNIVISSYKDMRQIKNPQVLEFSSSMYKNESILLVDEVSDTGTTFVRAKSFLEHFPLEKIYTCAPYIKPKTEFIPDFWLKKIDGWIIFPYDLVETYEAFVSKFGKEKAKKKLVEVGFSEKELEFLE